MQIDKIVNLLKLSNITLSIKSIILPVIMGSIVLFSCTTDIEQIKTITNYKKTPSISAKNIEIVYSDSAKVKVKLIATELKRFIQKEEPYTEFPKGIEIIFFDETQKVSAKITANYSKYFEKKEIWEAKYDVVVINKEKNEKLNTEYLIWDKRKASIHTDEFVKISTSDGVFYGQGLKATQDLSSWEIIKPKGIINVEN
ncbi:MAG: LPS export ABC transporter periplasmic protein LptC [Bacteroidales bacterium]|nr:LPS export ABC transporter periplasmic protein LptC [Bacteroidales bacterium]